MRCVDVIRELSAPTGDARDSAVADHLTRCPRCAEWAERDARVSRLWDSTRPNEPSADAWEAVWGRICQGLDQAPADVLPMKRPAPARRAWFVALGVAQVAAALFAVLYFTQMKNDSTVQVTQNRQNVVPQPSLPPAPVDEVKVPEAEIPPGELVVLREDGGRVQVIELALNGNSIQVDPAYEALNSLEAIAQQ